MAICGSNTPNMPRDLRLRVSSTWDSADRVFVRVGGDWKSADKVFAKVSGTWKEIYTRAVSFTSTASPGGVDTYGDQNTPSLTSADVSVTCDGSAPYSYAWEFVNGDSNISCDSPTSDTTAFSASGNVNDVWTANWRCRVVDDTTSISYTANVYITFQWQ